MVRVRAAVAVAAGAFTGCVPISCLEWAMLLPRVGDVGGFGAISAAVTLVAVIALRETVGISLRSIDEADRERLAEEEAARA